MKVVFRFDAGPRLLARLKGLETRGVKITCAPEGQDEPYLSALKEADALWHVLDPVTADQIARAPNLKLIQKIGVGTNTIDLDAAKAAGVAVCNMPGTNTQAVAETTLLLMLSALRFQPRLDRLVRSGDWIPDDVTRESFSELAGKTVGLVGFGNVPQRLAPVLTALGANVIYANRTAKAVPYPRFKLADPGIVF
jgi:phosphoglycerate dehydrogenase-like enzyme